MPAKTRRVRARPRRAPFERKKSTALTNTPWISKIIHYTYCPLASPTTDIRLIELLPGEHGDAVKVRIDCVPLVDHSREQQKQLDLIQLTKTLPPNWLVTKTPEEKFLFGNAATGINQWHHPDPSVDPVLYEPPREIWDFTPKYEALSYVWGSDARPHTITIEPSPSAFGDDDIVQPSDLAISDNLMEALQYLRHTSLSRVLWVDAVCINQDDNSEKVHQVRRMSDIYRLAHRVVVWLGPASKTSNQAFSTLQYLGEQTEIDSEGKVFPSPGAKETGWYDPSYNLPYNTATWDAILSLLERPWFQRVWVVQEIQLASTQPGAIIQCGHDTISHYILRRAVICLNQKDISGLPELRHRVTRAQMVFGASKQDPLWAILGAAVYRTCKDPRDKIYGLLGMSPSRFSSMIHPDYARHVDAGEVYKRAFLAHAHVTQRLELFYHCFLDGREIGATPSWVPDWSVESPWDKAQPFQFAASTSRAYFRYDSRTPEDLRVTGVRCATVNRVTHPMPKYLGSRLAVRIIRRWQPSHLATATYKPTGEPLRTVYGITLMCGEFKDRFPDLEIRRLDDWLRQDWSGALFGVNATSQGGRSAPMSSHMDESTQSALHFCEDRIFIETEEGYIGLAHEDTKIGDVIAVFLGCPIPVVLRPTNDGRFQVVGECFVHGLNDAIAILGPLPVPWKVVGSMEQRRLKFRFYNPETDETTLEDPRLDPMKEWERIGRDADSNDPADYDFFRHKATKETINYDPRLEPTELERRGVQLSEFTMV